MGSFRRMSAVLSVVLLVVACGSDDGGSARTLEDTTTTPDATTITTTAAAPRETDLAKVALQLSELPTGYAVDTSEDDDSGDDFCGEDPLQTETEEYEVTYTSGDFGPFVTNVVAQYAGREAAEEFMDSVVTLFEDCREYTDEEGIVFKFAGMSFPNLGDDTFAIRMSADSPFGPFAGDFVFVRVDDRVMLLANAGLGSIDSELTERLSRLVADRM